jgi:hypothetical protein
MSSPKRLFDASSRKPLVGNSSELSIRRAQGQATEVVFAARQRGPLLLSVRPGGF